MRHVFLSYAHEDESTGKRLRDYLEASGINVWMDRESLRPGELWMRKIRAAIRDGAFFVICLSKHVAARPASFVNQEMALALEELRLRPDDRAWFMPLRLDDCPMPAAIADFQHIDLLPDFETGAVALVNALLAGLLPELSPEHIFILGVRHHIGEKLRHFTEIGAAIREEILERWLALVDEQCLKALTTAFREAYGRLIIKPPDALSST